MKNTMPQVGNTIILTGVSQKGKNRVREHGNQWTVIRPIQFVSALGDKGFGVQSWCTNDWRWIRLENDVHFEWELL